MQLSRTASERNRSIEGTVARSGFTRTASGELIVDPAPAEHLAERAVLLPLPQCANAMTLAGQPLTNVARAVRLFERPLAFPLIIIPLAQILLRAGVLIPVQVLGVVDSSPWPILAGERVHLTGGQEPGRIGHTDLKRPWQVEQGSCQFWKP